jgi:hypothetical protein
VQKLERSRPKPGGMEETLEGGRGPPRALAPLEKERERVRNLQIKYIEKSSAFSDSEGYDSNHCALKV